MIAFLIHTFPLYSETFIAYEIKELRRLGLEIKLFGIRKPLLQDFPADYQVFFEETTYLFPINLLKMLYRNTYALFTKPDIYLLTLYSALTTGKISLKNRLRTISHFFLAIYFYPEIKLSGVKHIHVHSLSGVASMAMFLRKIYNINYSLTGHGSDMFSEKVLLANKINLATFTRVGTKYNRNHLKSFYHKQLNPNIIVIPFGINIEKFCAPAHFSNKPSPPIKLLTVGRLSKEKGHTILLEAAAQIRKKIDFRLSIIGEGSQRANLEKKRNELNLMEVVDMPGFMAEAGVLKKLRWADIFVLSSLSEGFGVVLLEAMACKVSVIAPSLNGIPEIITDKIDGRLYKTGSVNDLSNIILELTNDPTQRARLGEAAHIKVENHFELESSIKTLKNLLL